MTEEEKAAAAAATDSAQAEEVDFDNLDELLGLTVIGSDEPIKKTVFSSGALDDSFLDDDDDNDDVVDPKKNKVTASEIALVADNQDEEEDSLDSTQTNKGGRPSALVSAAKSMIEKGILQPFDDDKPIEQYTAEDFEELIQANIENKVSDTAENAPVELFKQLPEDVQAVVHYALNGGTDTKAVFAQLAKAQETFDLNVEDENDQELIIRQWLNTLGTDTADEIQDEIDVLKDRGDLEKYALKYKPKLDAKQAELIQTRLNNQAEAEKRKVEQSKKYQETIYKTLNVTELNGVPLPPTVQNMLYYGLIDKTKYQDLKGNNTNALGYLLEQHQFGEKSNPSLVAEALWLLADPDEYRKSVKQMGNKEANTKAMRLLKSEEASRTASASQTNSRTTTAPVARKAPIKKPGRGLFSR